MKAGALTTRRFPQVSRRALAYLAVGVAATAIGVYVLAGFGRSEPLPTIDPQLASQIAEVRQRVKVMKVLSEQNPGHLVAQKELGDAYLEMGALQKSAGSEEIGRRFYRMAIEQYGRVLEKSPGDENIMIFQSLAYVNMGDNANAIKLLEGVTRRSPGNQKAWYTLGWIYDREGMQASAESVWTKAVDIDPNSAIAKQIGEFMSSGVPEGQTPVAHP